jgi:vancomycin resistance protein YoaR
VGKHLSRATRLGIIAAAAPIALVAWASVVFALDRVSNGGEILGRVSVAGVELSGLSENQARRALQDLEAELAATPIVFDVQGTRFELLPTAVGFNLDDEALLQAALQQGRRGGLGGQFRWWVTHLGGRGDATIELAGTWDPAALEPYLETWEETAIADPPFEGGITVDNGNVIPQDPRAGTGIDHEGTIALVDAAMLDMGRDVITVPTAVRTPVLSIGEVGTAVAKAQTLISAPVVLSRLNPDVQVRFPRDVLAAALRSEVVGPDADPQIELSFALEPLLEYLEAQRAEIEFDPIDAEVVIRADDTPTIVPSRTGLLIDEEALPGAIQAAAASASRTGPFPYKEGALPEFSTEDAEALGINGLISYHDEDVCCTTFYTAGGDWKNQNRVHNIQLMANTVNGAIVMPGETFSLNEYVGQRTEEKGYLPAGAIIGPIIECCDDPANIGGGVSQFTTTLYNAVFWSGLEDVEHTPHTLYITRYPEGIEATLGWPDPDLQFRNNTDSAIYIKTEYTEDSLTVKFFGDNGGLKVSMERSDRTYFTQPEDYFDPDPTVPPGEQDITDEGTPGFTVTIYRTITYPDGSETSESWIWRYHPWPRRVSVNPCELPEDHEDYDPNAVCPSVVPDLYGLGPIQAGNRLAPLNLILVDAGTEATSNPDLDGKIVRQSPSVGTLLDADAQVQVWYGAYSGGG